MDIQLHFTTYGSGPDLILLHGNGEDSSLFAPQIEEFSRAFTVWAVDTRGHGRSPLGEASFSLYQFADDLADFMDEHGIGQADILGFSDGGNIALLFALERPERVRRLILNSANLWPEGLIEPFLNDIGPRFDAICHSESPAEQFEAALLALMLEEPHIDPADLARLTMPALVIAGDDDLVRGEHTQLIYESLPNAGLVILPGAHTVAFDDPAPFNAAVWDFFSCTEGELL